MDKNNLTTQNNLRISCKKKDINNWSINTKEKSMRKDKIDSIVWNDLTTFKIKYWLKIIEIFKILKILKYISRRDGKQSIIFAK
jgi:hypothetical protein